MVKNIAENKGGLFNRQNCRLYLQPFDFCETELYLKSRHIEWSRRDIAECYMILGGIPYYLSLLDPEMALSGNIDNLFFRKQAELWDEFDHLYKTLLANSDQYIKIVEQLCKDHVNQIKRKLGISGVMSAESAWFGKAPSETELPGKSAGAQIDLIIDRRNQVVNPCKIKYSLNPFEIDRDYEQKLRNKIGVFRDSTNCRKTIQLTLISTFGLHRNEYSNMVSNEVLLDDLFQE